MNAKGFKVTAPAARGRRPTNCLPALLNYDVTCGLLPDALQGAVDAKNWVKDKVVGAFDSANQGNVADQTFPLYDSKPSRNNGGNGQGNNGGVGGSNGGNGGTIG